MAQLQSHRRQNLLTGEWVLVSPQRTQRPWQGQVEDVPAAASVSYDATCYLCPGNDRARGKRNPKYSGPYAFDNDFPALMADADSEQSTKPLFKSEAENGCCRVVCFSEQHDRHLSGMTTEDVTGVLQFIANECRELDQNPGIDYVQAFENRGEMMGCSNPHPHAQIWATSTIPNEPEKERRCQDAYWQANDRSLLIDYIDAEEKDGSRQIYGNADAVSLVPFWATWPFEALLAPRQPAGALHEMSADELRGFADVLKQTLTSYDRLFGVPMPYSMGFHPRPSDGEVHPEWQFHVHIYPPLLRSATIRKHMVGFELMGMPQRDLTPESAAKQLRLALQDKQ
jgi:UDPglucose--hexose-1-phosphate uridylyltransferase